MASFPWLKGEVIVSDQCGDYHSTAATIFHHELGDLTGLFVEGVIHTEAGEGKGKVDGRFGLLSMSFQKSISRLHRRFGEELFRHMEIAGVGHNLLTKIDRTKFKLGSAGALPYFTQCASITFVSGGGVVLRDPRFWSRCELHQGRAEAV